MEAAACPAATGRIVTTGEVMIGETGELAAELKKHGLDITVPNVARIYDYFLGGKDSFEADRRAAAEIEESIPESAQACRQNRDFLKRVVRCLAAEAGIRQFIDVGSGLPTADNVHQIAKAIDPEARIVYVDYDPVVFRHAQVMLEEKSKGVVVADGDLRNPQGIIGNNLVREIIDFSQPVAILMFAILHFVTDAERPGEFLGQFRDVMAPGSWLALSHITDEEVGDKDSRAVQRVYQSASAPVVPRSRAQVIPFFDGLEIASPGLVDINDWPQPSPGTAPSTRRLFYGGIAMKKKPGTTGEPADSPRLMAEAQRT
jgi:S-adenosyl methyltransferase